jgi:hypothetical protein
MIGRTVVMNMQYGFGERMDLLTVERTYIQRRIKIKNKLKNLRSNQMNNKLIAQARLSRQENCVENSLSRTARLPATQCERGGPGHPA